ncbi:DNA alkylation repair protein [Paracoccus tegillarcae]|uniref:DNA alkylation repair protein n=1 Tax=Paracoccus tegillarcae TaxID=1529068 RepID=A0A2K9ES10_9RHOB|nr:DNA alkylation repair protein [Paracoccus tegillarcae]AUH34505.1 DNA alkylation repair protein [Paracoccus tegillarcae]
MTELTALTELADQAKAAQMAAYHKAERPYLGIAVPQIEALVAQWRSERDIAGRVALAGQLWDSNIHEARIAAAKLLTQARISDDGAVWAVLAGWVPDFDGWAIADQTMSAASRRLIADPARLDEVAGWTGSDQMWTRRAALVGTLPWAKMNHPKADDLDRRERILGWAASMVDDREWFIQKAIAWWLRDLSKRDAPRVQTFLAEYGARMKPFARREAGRLLQDR